MRRLVLLPVLALVALFLTAAPASAATVDSFTIDGGTTDTTAAVGQTLEWSATVTPTGEAETFTVFQTGPAADSEAVDSWGGPVETDENGTTSGSFTIAEPGTYTFSILANEGGEGGDTSSEEITVTVEEADADLTVIPVPEITFPDTCTAVLPETENVSFGVGFGQSGGGVEPGTLDLADFYNFGSPITIGAIPDEGFAFPAGAETFIELTPSADCFPQLVRAEDVCQAVEFTNTTDGPLVVQFGDIDRENPDAEFELAAGATRNVSTERESGFFLVGLDADGDFDQAGSVNVEQDCTPASPGETAPSDADFPTVAPAAGTEQASSASTTGLVALVSLLGAALVGGRRLLRSA